MDRIRRFQRSLITSLVGINTFVFSFSNDLGVATSAAYTFVAMIATLLLILAYIGVKKRVFSKRA